MVGLGVGLEDRRMNGENEVLLKNLEVDIRSRDWTYGLKYQRGSMAPSPGCNNPLGQINYLVINPMVYLSALSYAEQDSGITPSSS